MTIRKSIRFAVAGASLLGVLQANAQLTAYNQDDLLLNFRNATTTTDSDVVVDLGNASTFVSDIASLPGGTAQLDSVSGTTTTPDYTTTFTAEGVTGLYGAPASGNKIGFSAASSDQTTETIWLTRQISSPSLTPGTPSAQVSALNQTKTANDIAGIGAGALTGTALTGATSGDAAVVASGGSHSYQTEAQASGALPNVISYQGSQNPAAGAGGPIETSQTGSGDVYEALWQVPVTGSGSATFEGYFTFTPTGEVDFTTVSTVPEPSTYALLGVTGLFAWAFRRRIRSLVA